MPDTPERSGSQSTESVAPETAGERAQEAVGKELPPAGLASGLNDPAMQPVSDGNAVEVLAGMQRKFEMRAKGEGHAARSRKGLP